MCGHCLRSAPGTALLLLAFYAAVEAEKPEGWTKLKYKLCLLDLASAKLDQKLLIGSMATFAESRAKDEDTLATTNFSSYPNGTDIKARLEAALVEKKISDAEYVYKHIEVSECAPTEVEASEEKADTCLALDLSGEKYLRMFENYATPPNIHSARKKCATAAAFPSRMWTPASPKAKRRSKIWRSGTRVKIRRCAATPRRLRLRLRRLRHLVAAAVTIPASLATRTRAASSTPRRAP